MADIKTHIRELSVAVGVSLTINKNNHSDVDLINATGFYQYANEVISMIFLSQTISLVWAN